MLGWLKTWFLKRAARKVLEDDSMQFLSGYKTYIAAVGFIALGISQIMGGDLDQGLQRIMEGLAIFGIGHKLEKGKNG